MINAHQEKESYRLEAIEGYELDEIHARREGDFDAAVFYQSIAQALRDGEIAVAVVNGCTNCYLARCLLHGATHIKGVRL